jgi:hypothetical protein
MKKLFCLIILIIITSCSKNGDELIGEYISGQKHTYINKAGDDGYFITFTNDYNYDGQNPIYCTFKNGCFIHSYGKESFPVICINGNQLINKRGLLFHKVIVKVK